MNKYLVLYRAPIASFEKVMQAPPEEAKAGMDAWMAWSKKAASSIVDMGAPLGKTLRVDPKGASPTKNDLGGYSIMQAESKEALAKTFVGHPHFTMDGGFIEIMDLVALPGM